jgi:acetyl-CoA carboxylase biotin carboxyl carrier protein
VNPQAGPEAAAPPAKDANIHEFKSPMVGTFYRAPSPESPPYVTEGDRVSKEAVLCIIEAMKVMNEIKAEISGEIVEILVENGEAVEFGQPLFLIRTSG